MTRVEHSKIYDNLSSFCFTCQKPKKITTDIQSQAVPLVFDVFSKETTSIELAQANQKDNVPKEKFKLLSDEEIKRRLKEDLGINLDEKESTEKKSSEPRTLSKKELQEEFLDYISGRSRPLTERLKFNVIEDYINKGVDINKQDRVSFTALMYAIRDNNKQLGEFLLKNGAKISSGEGTGLVPGSRDEKEEEKLNTGKDPNKIKSTRGGDNVSHGTRYVDATGWNTLMLASWYGRKEMIDLLIKFGADVNEKSKNSLTPLIIASRGIGSDDNSRRNGNAWKIQFDTASHLIEKGADVNATSSDGLTPLMHACFNGNKNLAKLLIEKGANVNAISNKGGSIIGPYLKVKTFDGGWTPLICACYNNDTELVKLLLSNKADVNAHDGEGRTPLMYACALGHADVVALLLENGANINAKDNLDRTPLSCASMNGNTNLISLLIKKGAEVNPTRRTEANGVKILTRSPLMYAIKFGHLDAAKLLIQNGAKVNDTDTREQTALHYICNRKNEAVDFVAYLIGNHANVNLTDVGGRTPLYDACYNGHYNTANLLIKNGADFNIKAKDGTYPLDIALQAKNKARWDKNKIKEEDCDRLIKMLQTLQAKSRAEN